MCVTLTVNLSVGLGPGNLEVQPTGRANGAGGKPRQVVAIRHAHWNRSTGAEEQNSAPALRERGLSRSPRGYSPTPGSYWGRFARVMPVPLNSPRSLPPPRSRRARGGLRPGCRCLLHASPYQSDAGLSASAETLSGSQATLLDRHALQVRWAFESLSKARPQLRQRTWRMPPGHRLTEWRGARHFRCALSPCSSMRYAPRTIGPEQMGHIEFVVAIDLPFRHGKTLHVRLEVQDARRDVPFPLLRVPNNRWQPNPRSLSVASGRTLRYLVPAPRTRVTCDPVAAVVSPGVSRRHGLSPVSTVRGGTLRWFCHGGLLP